MQKLYATNSFHNSKTPVEILQESKTRDPWSNEPIDLVMVEFDQNQLCGMDCHCHQVDQSAYISDDDGLWYLKTAFLKED